MSKANQDFWESRYQTGNTGWDIEAPSPPLMRYCKDLDRSTRILIPGAGTGHDFKSLIALGFSDVSVIDIAAQPIAALKQAYPEHHAFILQGDFFKHTGEYDLILEQTFFCAIDPSLRPAYVRHTHDLLAADGRLAGVLFDRIFDKPGPPFGGERSAYEALFSSIFSEVSITSCEDSIAPRAGAEVFIEAVK